MTTYQALEHQEAAHRAAEPFNSFAFFMDTGTGKTFVLTRIITEKTAYEGIKSIVVCPLSVIDAVWFPEMKKFSPHLRIVNLWKASKKKKLPNPDIFDVALINYESLYRLPEAYLRQFQLIGLDESSKMKNPRARVTKFLLKIQDRFKYRYILSATPAPNNPLEYWPQMHFVNPEVLGKSYYGFRARNFNSYGYGGYQWAPKKGFLEKLPQMLSRQSYAVKKRDCLDLPPQTFESRIYTMCGDQRAIYDKLLKDNIAIYKNYAVLTPNELAQIMKLRQITAGFVISEQGKQIDISTGKLDLLAETLEEIGNNQSIIWCQFHWEVHKIMDMLGDKVIDFYGKTKVNDRTGNREAFQRGDFQYLIAHPRTAGHGLNLVNCHYSTHFSGSYSWEEEKQSQDRIDRYGQVNNTTYLHLLAKDSIDGVMYKAQRGKKSMSDAILNMIKSL